MLQEVKIINIGLEFLCEELRKQEVQVLHVNWMPPAKGDLGILSLLKELYSTGKGAEN